MLDSKIIDISSSEKEVEVTLKYDEFKEELDSEVRKQVKKIQIPGFRKGKVPLTMIKKMYGDALEHEATEKVANARFWKISEEQKLNPIGRPSLKDLKYTPGSDLFFKVQYETIPVLEVSNYKDNTVEIPSFQVHDEDVQREVDYIRNSNRILEPVDEVGEDRSFILDVDVIRVDDNGEPFAGTKSETLKIDLSNERVQPEILDNAKHKKTGETFSFSFTDERKVTGESGEETSVTENFIYKAEIKGIEKIILPELTEELIKKATKDKVTTEPELRELIKTDIINYYNQQTEELIRNKFIKQLIESNDFVPPVTLVNNVLEDLIKHEEEHSKKEGWKLDREEAANRLRKSAENEVKWYLIKDAIKRKENILINEEELNALAEKDSSKTGISVDKLLNYYKSSNFKEKMEDQKLFDFLKKNNKIEKVDNYQAPHVH